MKETSRLMLLHNGRNETCAGSIKYTESSKRTETRPNVKYSIVTRKRSEFGRIRTALCVIYEHYKNCLMVRC